MRLRMMILFAGASLVLEACGGTVEDTVSSTTSANETTTAVSTTSIPATTVPVQTTTSSSMSSVDPLLLSEGWRFDLLDLPIPSDVETLFGSPVKGLAVSSSGMVAIGELDSVTPEFRRPIVWYSPDGSVWERVGAEVFINSALWDVVAGGPGFVTVGNECSVENPQVCAADPAVWTSEDGRDWVRVPHDPSIFPGCSDQGGHKVLWEEPFTGCQEGRDRPVIEQVSATDGGLIAVGRDPTWTMLWYSADGLAWNRVDSSAIPSYPKVGDQGWVIYIENPGAWTTLGLLQPGLRCVDNYEDEKCSNDCEGFLWSSATGSEWSSETWTDDLLTEWWPVDTVEGDQGVVVFGNRSPDCLFCRFGYEPEPTTIVALHTLDGVEWTQATLPSADIGNAWAKTVASTPFGLIAMAEQPLEPQLVAWWHSNDGLNWDLIPNITNQPQELWANSLTWDGDELIMFGSAIEDGARVPVLGRWPTP